MATEAPPVPRLKKLCSGSSGRASGVDSLGDMVTVRSGFAPYSSRMHSVAGFGTSARFGPSSALEAKDGGVSPSGLPVRVVATLLCTSPPATPVAESS